MAQQQKSSITVLKEKAAAHAAKAKAIQNKIRAIEDTRILQVGRLVAEFQKKDWAGFDPSTFKKTATELLTA